MGASPEMLLSSSDGSLHTVALAGTRLAGTEEAWDVKNIEEQELVVDFIMSAMEGLAPEKGSTFTRVAGPVEHLCTGNQCRCCNGFGCFFIVAAVVSDSGFVRFRPW